MFSRSGDVDEVAFRQSLQRFVAAKVGVYIASGGAGQGHSLTWQELRRVYEIGVEECTGKIPIYASPPEQHCARATRDHSLLAIEAGVELVNVYGPAGWHAYKATDDELIAYYDSVLAAISHPVALSVQPLVGYALKPALIAGICRKHRQIAAINLSGVSDSYFVEIKDLL